MITLDKTAEISIKLESGNCLHYEFPKGSNFTKVIATLCNQHRAITEATREQFQDEASGD